MIIKITIILPLFFLLGIVGVIKSHPLLPENDLPPADGQPLQLFLVGGQSECTGGAKASDLNASNKYPELDGTIDGVWFAGYQEYYSPDRFFIAPLSAEADGPKFGPELSFGERIYNATNTRTMMVKYCVGGTNVRNNWNPDTLQNSWNKLQDDGTSHWLEENADLRFVPRTDSRTHQFANMVYTIRRTEEALTEGGIPYEWAGIVWIQGGADMNEKDPYVWKTFGEDTARVWNSFREEIGSDVPIVDTGGGTHNQLQSGKKYATQIVDDCLATTISYSAIANDDINIDCVSSASNSCFGTSGHYFNQELFDYYGYDPNIPPELKTSDATGEFDWFIKYPSNMHSNYDGTILKGRMLANEYLRAFTNYDQNRFEENDVGVLFPFNRCPENVLPSEDNICWIDYRDERLVEGSLCKSIESPSSNDNSLAALPSDDEVSKAEQRRSNRRRPSQKIKRRRKRRKPSQTSQPVRRPRRRRRPKGDSDDSTDSQTSQPRQTRRPRRRRRRQRDSDDSTDSQTSQPRRRRRRQGD